MSAIAKIKQQRIRESAEFYGTGSTEPAPFRGSGYEGAERRHRETVAWNPSFASPDQEINLVKPLADARMRDMTQNDGYAAGAVNIHKDSIVGACYRLNAKPNWRVLGAPEGWAEEFQQVVEARFGLLAESDACWLDAARRLPFTEMVRLAVGIFFGAGEVLGTAEWIKNDRRRPVKTAIQMVSPTRLSNPNGVMDSRTLRNGVEIDMNGRPTWYNIRRAYPTEFYTDDLALQWARVPAETTWGRRQVIHIVEQRLPGQNRGISEVTSALKQFRMTKQFQEITLQNAVINASYAASVESELPPDSVLAMMGGGAGMKDSQGNWLNAIGAYMSALNQYMSSAQNIKIDGAQVPHLFPGTKLAMKPMGTPGGVGTQFEESLLRYIAAALGLSYEEFARDFTKTNYSSARAAMANTWKFMLSRKKIVADRFASMVFALVLEEELANGNVPLWRGASRDIFYQPLMKEAFCECDWIGASRGQIDELKETEAAILRIKSGLSTYEIECSRLGTDFRDLFDQIAREQGIIKKKGLVLDNAATPKQDLAQTNKGGSGSSVESASNSTQDA
jgi:lambda family phage portal protein